jgi:cytochrome P450
VSASGAPVLRPGATGIKRVLMRWAMALMPAGFTLLRAVKPILKLGNTYVITRHDDVREVFGSDTKFAVPYKEKLDVIMGGVPFFLGMGDTAEYRADTAAMRKVVKAADMPRLATDVERRAAAIVQASGGRIEVVDTLVRAVTFDFCADYFGVPPPPGGDLRVWGTRLFEYQFVSDDDEIKAEVAQIAPALRAHIQSEIERRRATLGDKDDILGRCLILQAAKEPGFSDDKIRTALMGFIVGGPPQPPMVVPQAMEQLLRRPTALRAARAAAIRDDDDMLWRIVREAMRFDPLAPWMPRTSQSGIVAEGTSRERAIPAGAKLLVSFASAMKDGRRVGDPGRFEACRPENDYIHFGHGLHECFGRHINRATLHMMLKPLLQKPDVRRAAGSAGRLSKNGGFAESLTVEFG